MPKLKPKKAALKRFRVTKTGKVKRERAYASHLLSSKSGKRRRRLRRQTGAAPGDLARIRKMLAGM